MPHWVPEPPALPGPRIVHVNTHSGFGGVAELLHGLIRAQHSRDVAAGWVVISGTDDFYLQAKRMHYLMHGHGEPAALRGPGQRELYRSVLAPQARWLAERIGPDDTVVLHDAQTLGMAPELAATGARVAWHLHVGTEDTDRLTEVWPFFADDLAHVDDVLAARAEFLPPPALCPARRHVVAPAIDPDSPKNRMLTDRAVAELLADLGLTGTAPSDRSPADGRIVQDAPLDADAAVVLQVSRWDPLKDMLGVLRCFAGLDGHPNAHLVLAGPDPREVADDPEGLAILDEVRSARAALPTDRRARVHLVLLSMRVPERNALLINALQRRADVVVQKSLEEGFGLTLTESMFKGRAVIASDLGGLRTQVRHADSGLLVDPADDDAVRSALSRLLSDPALRARLGRRAKAEVASRFLMPRLADDYAEVVRPGLRADRITAG